MNKAQHCCALFCNVAEKGNRNAGFHLRMLRIAVSGFEMKLGVLGGVLPQQVSPLEPLFPGPGLRRSLYAAALVLLLLTGCQIWPEGEVLRNQPPPTIEPTFDAATSPTPSMCHYQANGTMPDSQCTPGVWNPAVSQATIATTICKPGWTATIRPSTSYTNALKLRQLVLYGQPTTNPAAFEEDHYFPLEGGGSPSDPRNLFPEPIAVARQKDQKENALRDDICSGRKTLEQAHRDWEAGWEMYR